MEALLMPIRYLKVKYLPLLAVYFAVGLMGLSTVTSTFFYKNHVSLDASELIGLGIWVGLPWSIKMVFGSLIDGVSLFGNNRKNYIHLGNLMITLGVLGMADHASTGIIFGYIGQYAGLLLSGLLVTTGIVIADIVADTMAIEYVEKGDNYDQELGMVQVLSRLSLALGAVLGAAITGWLAATYSASTVYLLGLVCPAVSVVATLACKLNDTPTKGALNYRILLGGILYGLICVLCGMFLGDYSQEVLFVLALGIIGFMLKATMKGLDPKVLRAFVLAMIAIFLFRVVPGIGPAGSWYYIEELKFDEKFLGTLSLIASISSLAVLWFLSKSITGNSILKTMAVLVGLVTILSLPDIMVYYGLHEILGVSARSMILVDTALIAPIAGLSMIPLGVLIARNAPPASRAVYISLTASLMNISLVGGDVITKLLNKLFVVTRSDFSQLGNLMIASLTISTILSIIGLLLLRRAK